MAVPDEVDKQIRHLLAAAEMLSRISDEPGDEQQGTRDVHAIVSALTHASKFERWARRRVRDAMDELEDQNIQAAGTGDGGRRR